MKIIVKRHTRNGHRVKRHIRTLNQAGADESMKVISMLVTRRGGLPVAVVEFRDREGHRGVVEANPQLPLMQEILTRGSKQGQRIHFMEGAKFGDIVPHHHRAAVNHCGTKACSRCG